MKIRGLDRNVARFSLDLKPTDIPQTVMDFAQVLLADLLCVAVAGSHTPMAKIAAQFASSQMGGDRQILFNSMTASPSGAAMANAFIIDSMDAHDGYKPAKGHAGCASLAAVVATSQPGLPGDEFLAHLVLGYEIGCRAGIILHNTAKDYHTSGAWMAIATAAIAGRAIGLSVDKMNEAMGVAEFHGPRSPMMRCIDYPTMVKDGSGWGALAGVSAAYLANSGFTGAPAEIAQTQLAPELWSDLGSRWILLDQYVKPEPVCRWAQPAIHAAMTLKMQNDFEPADIERVDVTTFSEAAQLAVKHPETTEQAQYSLPFPLAAAIVHGTVTPERLMDAGLADTQVNKLAQKVNMHAAAEFDAAFPIHRFAVVRIILRDGQIFESEPTEASGDPESPLSDIELQAIFHRFSDTYLGENAAADLHKSVSQLRNNTADDMLEMTSHPAKKPGHENR